nr:carbohydrate ABC transporter permease [Gynuella sunshinyii]
MRSGKALAKVGLYGASGIVFIVSVFPFYYAFTTSMSTGVDLFIPHYWPESLNFTNYANLLSENGIGRSLVNSFIVAATTVLCCLLVSVTASFALARIHFKGKGMLLLTILCFSMFPQVSVLSGMFEFIRFLGLYDHLGALVLSYLTFSLPFTIWVLTTFMRTLPADLEEAAIMDGASIRITITHIYVPLLAPAMVTTGLLAFIAAWNEFLFALTFVISSDNRTVPVAISMLTGASKYELPWGNIMAFSVIATVPLILLVLIFQRRIVSGLTNGAVKG